MAKMPEKTPEKEKVVKDAAYFSKIGRLGGLSTKAKMKKKDPNYYSRIGTLGGAAIMEKRGKEYLSAIGRIGKGGNK